MNYWGKWAQNLFDKVSPFFEEEGSVINPYFLSGIDINKQILRDLKLFPIWGNILSSQFEFGRIPATSAPVEGEINKIKLRLKRKYSRPVRVDEFVDDQIRHMDGKCLIICSEINEKILGVNEKRQNMLWGV